MMVAIYTTDMKSWLVSGSIRFAEQWNRSHVLLAFTEDYAEGRQFTGDYFESINKKDSVTGKTGVRGPIDIKAHLWDWINEDPKNRQFTVQPLPWFTQLEQQETRMNLMQACPLVTYPAITVQLWGNFKMLVGGYKYGIPPIKRNTTQWDCSETIARVLPHWFRIQVLNLGDWLYEEYIPGTFRGENPGFGPGIYQMIEKYKEKLREEPFYHNPESLKKLEDLSSGSPCVSPAPA